MLAGLACGAALALACWLPLILHSPALWREQLSANVLGRASSGLFARLLHPSAMLSVQSRQLLEHAGAPLLALFAAGTAGAFVRKPARGLAWWTIGVFAALWWLSGTHPAKGYWVLPAALAAGATAAALVALPVPRAMRWTLAIAALACCVPGGGGRTAANLLRHWHDPDYDHRAVVAAALAELPPDAALLADQGCVLDCWLAGRNVVVALDRPGFFDSRGQRAEVLLLTGAAADVGLAPAEFGMPRRLFRVGGSGPDAAWVEAWGR
jgi:hypothetical protein